MSEEERSRIHVLDTLRGAASLAVCWFHLTAFKYNTPDGSAYTLLRGTGRYGWLGVEVFFVISGFVLPYSMHRAGYRLRDYPAFVLKRLVRLDPPYLAAIACFLAYAFGHAFFRGELPLVEGTPVTYARVLLHLGYANAFFKYEWLNPSFWTLAIEFQYYLLVGLVFPALGARRAWLRRAAFFAFGLAALLADLRVGRSGSPYSPNILRFTPVFLLGVATFQRRSLVVGRLEYVLLVALAAGLCFVTVRWPSTAAALAAVFAINFYKRRAAVTDFFGKISYSLYLTHWPVGHLALGVLGLKLFDASSDAARIAIIFAAFAVCVAAACVLYLAVERPARRWSSRIRYGSRRATVAVSGLAAADTQQPPSGAAPSGPTPGERLPDAASV